MELTVGDGDDLKTTGEPYTGSGKRSWTCEEQAKIMKPHSKHKARMLIDFNFESSYVLNLLLRPSFTNLIGWRSDTRTVMLFHS